MVIYTKKLKKHINDYNVLISDYEEIYNNFYYESKSIDKYWSSPIANYFFSLIEKEELASKKFYEELVLLKDVFDYLINNYKDYEEKIIIDLSSKDSIINKINKYKTQDITYLLNEIDSNFINVDRQKNILRNINRNIEKYKENFKTFCNNIEKIESEIKQKLLQITITPLEEVGPISHELGSVDELYINTDEIENIIKKLNMYCNYEDNILDSLKTVFNEINSNYLTDNRTEIYDLGLKIISKYKIILNNHLNNIKLLENNIENSKNALTKAQTILEQMDGGIYE